MNSRRLMSTSRASGPALVGSEARSPITRYLEAGQQNRLGWWAGPWGVISLQLLRTDDRCTARVRTAPFWSSLCEFESLPICPGPLRHLRALTRKWFASVVEAFALEEHHVRLLILAGENWDRGQIWRAKHGPNTA